MFYNEIKEIGINEISYEKLGGIYCEVIYNNQENNFKTVYPNKKEFKKLLLKLFNKDIDFYMSEYNENIIIANESEKKEAFKLFVSKLNIQLSNFEIIKVRASN